MVRNRAAERSVVDSTVIASSTSRVSWLGLMLGRVLSIRRPARAEFSDPRPHQTGPPPTQSPRPTAWTSGRRTPVRPFGPLQELATLTGPRTCKRAHLLLTSLTH